MSNPQVLSPKVQLDKPIQRGAAEPITELQLRKPSSGELRGLTLVDLANLDVNALHKLLPRITLPMITPAEAQDLEPADLLSLGTEVSHFLLSRVRQAEVSAAL